MAALPCILEKTSHVLTAKGRFQRIDRLKTGEHIINAYGKARPVRQIEMLPPNVRERNGIDLIGLELQGNPYRLRVPDRTLIPVKTDDHHTRKDTAWCAVRDIAGRELSVALPDSFEFHLPTTTMTWGGANYHVGFLLGTFMVCGIIVDEYANKSEYVCDSQDLPRILASFGALGHTEENGMLEVRRRTAYCSQVISRSPVLHDMNKKLFDNGRTLPQEWLSLDRDFLRGMYHGIAHGHLLFVDQHTYHQLMFIQLVLEKKLSRCERILSARSEKEKDPKYIAFVTDDKTTTSAICEGVPVACLPKS